MHQSITALALGLAAATATAQGSPPTEFPADAKSLTAEALRERLTGRAFRVAPAKSSPWLLEFQAGGPWSIKTESGFVDSGTWRVEDSKLCTAPQKSKASCNDMRQVGDVLYLKRDSGEVVRLEPR